MASRSWSEARRLRSWGSTSSNGWCCRPSRSLGFNQLHYNSRTFNYQNLLKKSQYHHIARLAPLLPQLAFALRRRAGEVPAILKVGGSHRERHIAALVSLGVAAPATVSELARRIDMSIAHASMVVGDLARAGLVDARARRK